MNKHQQIALSVECPTCRRGPGEVCMKPDGTGKWGYPHKSRTKAAKRAREEIEQVGEVSPEDTNPDWSRECENCGATPIVPITGLCGPCTFGEAETAGGNW